MRDQDVVCVCVCVCVYQIPYLSEEAGGVSYNKLRIAEIPSCAMSTNPPEKMHDAVTITTVHFFPVFSTK